MEQNFIVVSRNLSRPLPADYYIIDVYFTMIRREGRKNTVPSSVNILAFPALHDD
jgi:hypothetical protein